VRRHQQWMRWLSDSGNMRKVSLPPVEKMAREVRQIKENISYSPPVRASTSAVRGKRSTAQEREYRGYTPRGTLWFYLYGEDMRKWDGKRTSSLEERVCELRGKTITKGDSVGKNAAPVSSSQLSRAGRLFDLDPDTLEGTSKSFLQQVSSKFSDQD